LKRQEAGEKLRFYMFDIIRLGGDDKTAVGAYDRFTSLRNAHANGLMVGEYVECTEEITGSLFDAYAEALANGEEGIVLKDRNYPYKEGKKPAWSMIKAKKNDSADVICIGFEDANVPYIGDETETWKYWVDPDSGQRWPLGNYYDKYTQEEVCMFYAPVTKGHYYGWKTSMNIGLRDDQGNTVVVGKVASGLNDVLRAAFAVAPDTSLGRVVECNYMEITEKALRHPTFVRFRDDKEASECTVKVVFDIGHL